MIARGMTQPDRQCRAGLPAAMEGGVDSFRYATDEEWAAGFLERGPDRSREMAKFITEQKGKLGDSGYKIDFTAYEPGKLKDPHQKKFFKLLQASVKGEQRDPVRCVVRGGGGVGKSYVVNCFRRWLSEVGEGATFGAETVMVLAPTGTAAFNVSGRTLHSALKLPVPLTPKTFRRLKGDALTDFQSALSTVSVFIVDEMSMVGRRTLKVLDDRLRQAKGAHTVPFGGISVFLCGDFGQLPPIGDKVMYSADRDGGPLSLKGRTIWHSFTHSVTLRRNYRQSDSVFRDALWRLRCGKTKENDYALFASRGIDRLPPQERELFQNASFWSRRTVWRKSTTCRSCESCRAASFV